MDNIIEVIFTLIVGFFWLFGGSLFKNRKDEEPHPSDPLLPNNKTENDRESGDYDARQEDIREAIRRKIVERRQQRSDSAPVVVLEEEPQQQYSESFGQQEEANEESSAYATSSEEETSEETFSWNLEGNVYEQEMQDRLQEIEETKRKAEVLSKEVKQKTWIYGDQEPKKDAKQEIDLFAGSIQSALKNPQNARAAFVYAEILGKPMSLRRGSETGSGV